MKELSEGDLALVVNAVRQMVAEQRTLVLNFQRDIAWELNYGTDGVTDWQAECLRLAEESVAEYSDLLERLS